MGQAEEHTFLYHLKSNQLSSIKNDKKELQTNSDVKRVANLLYKKHVKLEKTNHSRTLDTDQRRTIILLKNKAKQKARVFSKNGKGLWPSCLGLLPMSTPINWRELTFYQYISDRIIRWFATCCQKIWTQFGTGGYRQEGKGTMKIHGLTVKGGKFKREQTGKHTALLAWGCSPS